jgi:hypothetical protein
MPNKRQLKAGAKVSYHGTDGDRDARILRFNGVGGANLQFDDESLALNAREGRNAGEWTAIPPRRGT